MREERARYEEPEEREEREGKRPLEGKVGCFLAGCLLPLIGLAVAALLYHQFTR